METAACILDNFAHISSAIRMDRGYNKQRLTEQKQQIKCNIR